MPYHQSQSQSQQSAFILNSVPNYYIFFPEPTFLASPSPQMFVTQTVKETMCELRWRHIICFPFASAAEVGHESTWRLGDVRRSERTLCQERTRGQKSGGWVDSHLQWVSWRRRAVREMPSQVVQILWKAKRKWPDINFMWDDVNMMQSDGFVLKAYR
jgi:hypothetical protein